METIKMKAILTTIFLIKRNNICRIPYLGPTIDGFSKPDVFLDLRIFVPVLDWDAFRLSLDASFTSREITVYFDSIHSTTLVRINPIVSFLRKYDIDH